MIVPPELLARVDAWRNQQTVPPTRAAAMRHLIERSLLESTMLALTPQACRRLAAALDHEIARVDAELDGADEDAAADHSNDLGYLRAISQSLRRHGYPTSA